MRKDFTLLPASFIATPLYKKGITALIKAKIKKADGQTNFTEYHIIAKIWFITSLKSFQYEILIFTCFFLFEYKNALLVSLNIIIFLRIINSKIMVISCNECMLNAFYIVSNCIRNRYSSFRVCNRYFNSIMTKLTSQKRYTWLM